jgi:hypothetical protein
MNNNVVNLEGPRTNAPTEIQTKQTILSPNDNKINTQYLHSNTPLTAAIFLTVGQILRGNAKLSQTKK